jgi:hypothetical protein
VMKAERLITIITTKAITVRDRIRLKPRLRDLRFMPCRGLRPE